ncbi:hypothetical protein CABS02_03691 [Colletotrichum abscissum]|uniref:Uncharacterized protein n=1 Tax=Colletotrichum abscissum TaxID=1671311 RepID=A0A9P9XKP6_9PEZI|nr:hypothetical protein CABS02_03691 [Colletotrichum abscissum]
MPWSMAHGGVDDKHRRAGLESPRPPGPRVGIAPSSKYLSSSPWCLSPNSTERQKPTGGYRATPACPSLTMIIAPPTSNGRLTPSRI